VNGWIKLQRKITEHWIWQDPEMFRAWVWMLLKANHESDKFLSKGQLVELKKGQFVTSIEEMKKAFGFSKNRVYRFLKMLEKEEMISRNGQANGTTITIVNYGLYQSWQNTNGPTDGQSGGQPNGQADGQSDGQLTRIYKNNKELKEGGEGGRRMSQEETDKMMAEWIAGMNGVRR